MATEITEKIIKILNGQLEKLDDPEFDFNAWKGSTITILDRAFGRDNSHTEQLEKIEISAGGFGIGDAYHSWDNVDECKAQGREIVRMSIVELEEFGLPALKENSPGGISINLSQNQTVNINFIIKAVEDTLTGTQVRELREIVESDGPREGKVKKIFTKLKSFGNDVGANILANVLTNPAIWVG